MLAVIYGKVLSNSLFLFNRAFLFLAQNKSFNCVKSGHDCEWEREYEVKAEKQFHGLYENVPHGKHLSHHGFSQVSAPCVITDQAEKNVYGAKHG